MRHRCPQILSRRNTCLKVLPPRHRALHAPEESARPKHISVSVPDCCLLVFINLSTNRLISKIVPQLHAPSQGPRKGVGPFRSFNAPLVRACQQSRPGVRHGPRPHEGYAQGEGREGKGKEGTVAERGPCPPHGRGCLTPEACGRRAQRPLPCQQAPTTS